MTDVYVVFEHDYDDLCIKGVFESEEDADEELRRIREKEGFDQDCVSQQVFALGEHTYPDGEIMYSFAIYRVGKRFDVVAFPAHDGELAEEHILLLADEDAKPSYMSAIAQGYLLSNSHAGAVVSARKIFLEAWESEYGRPFDASAILS